MRRVELHCHSTASDGTDTPAELMGIAHRAGLSAVALTDHDTLAGHKEAREAAESLGIEFVPGVELGAHVPGGELHILGFDVDGARGGFDVFLTRMRDSREERNVRILRRLAELGVPVSESDVRAEVGDDGAAASIGRPHMAAALVKKGHVTDFQDAFDRYLAHGAAAYVPRRTTSPQAAVRAIVASGGVAVVAHPFTIPAPVREAVITSMVADGLGGLEVHHSHQSPEVRAEMIALAKSLDLVTTGGSDYHGTRKPDIVLGSGRNGNARVTYDVLEAIRARRPPR